MGIGVNKDDKSKALIRETRDDIQIRQLASKENRATDRDSTSLDVECKEVTS